MFNLIPRRIDRIRVHTTLKSHRPTMKASGVLWISSTGGPNPSGDLIFLRDGSVCGRADAAERLALDPGLLYPTRDEAVRDGLASLRAAHAAPGGR